MYNTFNLTTRKPFAPLQPAVRPPGGGMQIPVEKKDPPKMEMSKPNMVRCINYLADLSGCSHWRLIWPELLLKGTQRFNITSDNVMVGDPRYYGDIKTVRIQRQATEQQKSFFEALINYKNITKNNFNIIYEIDDIIFAEDIPLYNHFRQAFDNPTIRRTSMEIMQMADEMTVTCDFMKEYYEAKTGHKKITVIPNFIPRFWMDRFYNIGDISKNFEKNKKKPRILYCGSGAHYDIGGRVKHKDDLGHVRDVIRKTCNEFQWVFFGGHPIPLKDLIESGKIEYHPWETLQKYPYKIASLNVQLMYAPLVDNTFNKAKSDLKFIEGCAYGIPTICQDIETYSNAFHKFTTGDELIDKIKYLTKDHKKYIAECKRARRYGDTRWLEDNLGYYEELYKYPHGHPERKKINKLNKISS